MLRKKIALLLFAIILPLSFVWAHDSPTDSGVTLTILYFNDFHGYDPVRLARIASAVKDVRAREPNVLLLNAGDAFTRGPYAREFRGALEFAAFNAMGMDAFTLGNNEFKATDDRRAIAFLADRIAQADFPVLAANVTERSTGKTVYGTRPYAILARGGLRIGIIGVTSSRPGAEVAEKFYRFADEFKAAKAAYANVAPEVDAVIALTHIGFADDLALADSLPDLVAIVGGHSHTLLTKPLARGAVPVVQAGSEGAYLGHLSLRLKKSGARWKLDSYDGGLLVVGDYPPDPQVLAVVNGYLKTLPKKKH